MYSMCLLTGALSFAIQVSAIPNPHPMITARAVASSIPSANLDNISDFSYSTLPSSVYAALTSEWGNVSVSPAELAAESSAYAQFTSEFYKSASPSELSAIAALNAQESAIDAAYYDVATGVSISPQQSSALADSFESWTLAQGAGVTPTRNSAAQKTSATATGSSWANPLPVSNTPGADSITCVKQSGVEGSDTVNTTACTTAISNACRKLNQSKTGNYLSDEWIWSGGSAADNDLSNTLGCAVGYWLPKSAVNRNTAAANPLVPSVADCKAAIFGTIMSKCLTSTNAASVNVAVLPDPANKDNSGQQVDSGKVSFLLAPQPWPCNDGYNCFH